ncbi:LysR substrate-binding domain-containing protein [Pseudomonas sp. NPDC007930]|uniref:LysR family transcriptional regulator n=1 Tax=Pseudomonas sp. NPDC007930 TaxID=3364417 RepID=UPI0036E11B2A
MMNLLHWRVLVAVADTGSLAQAAEQCALSSAAASQALSELEQQLGAPLVLREGRQARLTALGEEVIGDARQMLALYHSLRQRVAKRLGLHHGCIHLGAFEHPLFDALAGPLAEFRALHPQVQIQTVHGQPADMPAWLARGSVDLALTLDSGQGLALGKDDWWVAVPAAHPLARRDRGSRLRLGELASLPFVLAHPEQVQPLFARAGLALENVSRQPADWAAAVSCVREGYGVSLLPASCLPARREGVALFGLAPALAQRLSLVAREGAQPAVAVLLDYLKAGQPA